MVRQRRQTTIVKRDKLKVLMKIDNFTYTVVLGKGSFGKVLLAKIEGCDGVVAVKGISRQLSTFCVIALRVTV